jgi:hypothetical protein
MQLTAKSLDRKKSVTVGELQPIINIHHQKFDVIFVISSVSECLERGAIKVVLQHQDRVGILGPM